MHITDASVWRTHLRTRMPFKYGIATLTELPHVFIQVRVEFDSGSALGMAADHLPPKWFTKDPARDPRLEIDDMLAVIRQAMAHAAGIRAPTVFKWWQELYAAQDAWALNNAVPPLLAHFGTSLIERALIDAFCRFFQITFTTALEENRFGLDLGALRPRLAGRTFRDVLPGPPPRRIFARHTVGLSDPLTEADIAPTERVDDGLPQSLERAIAVYGLRHFKLKAGGTPSDLDRLRKITAVLVAHAPSGWRCTIDGNESFHSVEAFRSFWRSVEADPALEPLRRGLMFVEQPFHRDLALHDEIGALAADWPDRPPIIIDESDSSLGSLPRALELGYAGTSHKNCKGIFKGIANACLIASLRETTPMRRLCMSGEDLANIGPVALLADLAVQANLGITSVERNGHHYFAGLSAWPAEIQEMLLTHHPDIYTRSPKGWPTVQIADGQMSVSSALQAPFGLAVAFDPKAAGATRI